MLGQTDQMVLVKRLALAETRPKRCVAILGLKSFTFARSTSTDLLQAALVGASPSPCHAPVGESACRSVGQAFLVYVQEAFCGCCTKPLLQKATFRANSPSC
jgi:hypothetical protein